MSKPLNPATLKQAERELEQLEGFYKELSADAALTAASMAPPPAGTAADVVSLGRSLWKGDWGGALLDAVGIIPIVGDGIKGTVKGTKIAAKMKEVSAAIKAAKVKLAKMKKNAAAKKAKATKDATKNKTKNNSVQACKKCNKEAGGGIIEGRNTKTRLPRENGNWDGKPGESNWYSDLDEVNEVTGGKPIPFKKGRPDFSEWSKGEVTFKKGELNGTDSDFSKVYEKIAKEKGLKNKTAAKHILKEKGLTPHHLDDKTIQLIPSKLHGKIPHVGSASDMRNIK